MKQTNMQTTKMIKVTVYIPAHNYGRYIEKAIRSVLKQTMTDWELIIVDDGSTDNTMDIIREFNNDSRIRIIEQENKGLNVTNNIALRLATGKYIMRLDADDYLDENALLVLSNILETKLEIGLVYPDYYHIDEDGEIIEIVRRKKVEEEVELLDLPAHGACTMIRKECLMEIGGYIEDYSCQDGYELWLRIIQHYKPYNVNIPLFYYRQHPKSLTEDNEKVLNTRRKIKRDFVERNNACKLPKILGIIPVVSRSIYPQCGPFVELAGRPLIWYTLNELKYIKNLDRVVLFSDDEKVLEYAGRFSDLLAMKRPIELAKTTTRIQDIVCQLLDTLKSTSNYEPEAVCILYITTPLRRARHIDKAVDTFTIFDVDSVISIQEELSYCYFHRNYGLTPISKSSRQLRIERDAIYKENGAVFIGRADDIRKGHLLGERVGHITMLPEESVKINSTFDLWLAGKILREWNVNNFIQTAY